MLNEVNLQGRLTKDCDLRYTPNGNAVAAFTLAVDRSYVKQGEERKADFISCVAWNKTAEFIGNYFKKGSMIIVTGELQTRTYEDNQGVKKYVTEVVVAKANFAGEKRQESQQSNNQQSTQQSPAKDINVDDLPF